VGIKLRDTDREVYVGSENISFWGYYSNAWNNIGNGTTNADGNTTYVWDPNSSAVEAGVHNWMANHTESAGYKYDESANFTITVVAQLKNYLELPLQGEVFYETQNISIRFNVTDEYYAMIDGATINSIVVIDKSSTQYSCSTVNDEGSGWYNCAWNSSGGTVANWYAIKINSSKQYYNDNITTFDDRFYLEDDATLMAIELLPHNYTIYNVSQTLNQTFTVNVTINNTGLGNASSSTITFSLPATWSYNASATCADLDKNESCIHSFKITAAEKTQPGMYNIIAIVNWTNPDSSTNTTNNTSLINVTSNPILEIVQDSIIVRVMHNDSNITTFTVNSTGNDYLYNSTSTCESGIVCADFTVTFNPETIASLDDGNEQTVTVNVSVPIGYYPGSYSGIIRTNATDTICYSPGRCLNTTQINVIVPVSRTWTRSPLTLESMI